MLVLINGNVKCINIYFHLFVFIPECEMCVLFHHLKSSPGAFNRLDNFYTP